MKWDTTGKWQKKLSSPNNQTSDEALYKWKQKKECTRSKQSNQKATWTDKWTSNKVSVYVLGVQDYHGVFFILSFSFNAF